MAHPVPDFTQINDAIAALTKRLVTLEDAFVDEEENLGERERLIARRDTDITSQLQALRLDINSIRSTLAGMDAAFTRLTLELKQSVKQDEVERLSMRVDRMNFEGLLSARGLTRELAEAGYSDARTQAAPRASERASEEGIRRDDDQDQTDQDAQEDM